MLREVAEALGPELCQQVAFVGGCTTFQSNVRNLPQQMSAIAQYVE